MVLPPSNVPGVVGRLLCVHLQCVHLQCGEAEKNLAVVVLFAWAESSSHSHTPLKDAPIYSERAARLLIWKSVTHS
jgi:hypothetical protein